VDANRIKFRSALLPVWRVATMWTAALAGGLLGLQAFQAGGAPSVPQIAITAASAVVCGVIFTLAVGFCVVEVNADGLQSYDFFGLYKLARWDAVTEVRPTNFAGLRYVRVYAAGTPRPRWVPLFLTDMPGFAAAVARLGGADHPIVRALPQEARRTRAVS
jgi:hypothetical protein